MILNTGQRTDIPAFFPEWFFNRVRAGEVLVRNPVRPELLVRYRIDPAVVDAIVFCTKNPAPMLPRLGELAAFRQVWHVTVTPYGRDLEPFVPPKKQVVSAIRALSRALGPEKVVWRYDPVIVSSDWPVARHAKAFETLARLLEGAVESAVISFVDLYQKTKANLPGVREVSPDEIASLVPAFLASASRHGMRLFGCHETQALPAFPGVDCSGCASREALERALGISLAVPADARGVRANCPCLLGHDIGAYDTCLHGCRYCYATRSFRAAEANVRRHDPASPLLVGRPGPDEEIRDAVQVSWLDPHPRLPLPLA